MIIKQLINLQKILLQLKTDIYIFSLQPLMEPRKTTQEDKNNEYEHAAWKLVRGFFIPLSSTEASLIFSHWHII